MDILFESETREEILNKEVEFISLYGLKCDCGTLCNITTGGDGGYDLSKEQRHRISRRMVGNTNGKGYKHNEESKRKISEAHKGIEPWCKGKKMSKEFGKKISSSTEGMPKPPVYNCRPQQKKVYCYTNGVTYNSICECVREFFGISTYTADNKFRVKKNNVSKVCNGKKKDYLGHKFKFV